MLSTYERPGRVLGLIGRDPSVSKSNWLHVAIFRFLFTSFEVCLALGFSPFIASYSLSLMDTSIRLDAITSNRNVKLCSVGYDLEVQGAMKLCF